MKSKILLLLLVLTAQSGFSEEKYENYHAFPIDDTIKIYDSFGFFMNESQVISSEDLPSMKILEVSENAYKQGGNYSHFYKVQIDNNRAAWVYGGDVVVASLLTQNSNAWYKRTSGPHYLFTYFEPGNKYYFYRSGNRTTRRPSYDNLIVSNTLTEVKYKHPRDWFIHIFWDEARGLYLIGENKNSRESTEEYDYLWEYRENNEFLGLNKILDLDDEKFWMFFANNDFESLLKLKKSGYDKYDSYSLFKKETPLYESIKARNFPMIRFLLNNGFSMKYSSGNYDGSTSCLLDPIRENDIEMVKFLIENGVGQNIGGEMGTDYDLSYAIRFNHPEMIRLLISLNYNPNEYMIGYSNGEDSSGAETNLLSAISKNQMEVAEILLENGADPNLLSFQYAFGNFNSKALLEYADNSDMKELLRNYGAKERKDFTFDDYNHVKIGLSGTINSTRVRFRSTPSLSGEHLGFFENGENITVITSSDQPMKIDNMNSPWYLVRRKNGETGWVYGHFVDVSRRFILF